MQTPTVAGEFRVRAGHERRKFFVAGLDEARLVAGLAQGGHDAVDAVAGIAVDAVDAPIGEALDDEIADGLGHGVPSA